MDDLEEVRMRKQDQRGEMARLGIIWTKPESDLPSTGAGFNQPRGAMVAAQDRRRSWPILTPDVPDDDG